MTHREFEKLVAEGIEAIPERFLRKLNNVAVVIEDERGKNLLGLYEGIPQTGREHYGVGPTLPDRITIFRRTIMAEAGGDPARAREIVRDTVWHEIAHHFGMDEGRVRQREAKRRKRGATDGNGNGVSV